MHLALNFNQKPYLGVVLIPEKNELWISNGVNGFLFKTGCSKSLYDAIMTAINRRHLWNQIGAKARETILERNDISNEMKKMYKLMDLV